MLQFLRSLFVHPRPDLSDSRVDLFERIAQRGQRLEQVVPVKAPEVGGAGVPGVFEEGQGYPHPDGPTELIVFVWSDWLHAFDEAFSLAHQVAGW